MGSYNKQMEDLLNMIVKRPQGIDILISFAVTFLLAAIMTAAYKHSHSKIYYSKKFSITLVMIAFISTVFMDLIQSNLALSLGMLGSLSIVRFRTNIKDPRDMGFIFWSMAIGIASATGSYLIGIAGSLAMAVFMILTSRKDLETEKPMLVVIRGSRADLDLLQQIIDHVDENNHIRAKNVMDDSFELVYEAILPERKDNFIIRRMFSLEGIDSVNILAQNEAA
ncbi:DUF4956 domain-containing protein [Clostridium polynesiense]|uniref:DUF4956 domain-containing protein n=1 Tax=Clostridium polynesiense TaxID=1325933 RepID=UPI000ABC8FFA|nr:DUF4956 domain-containing protein [Clostridium polynesiense]